ncbi:helix-turn-helix transcriptional regulator [Arthrobacter sp. B6]|uniref:helix-turn-helix transcriptional regulator n=1 Tax=Arthrobacter sp. B6 TaxID=1570137 RepID=UPI000B07FB41|nr:transcriptional regulator [Arthrobacter sp. B6]
MRRLPWAGRLAAVASLGDEKSRQLFELITSSEDAVGRDEAALAVGLPRSTASFHLDRLVKDGLLAVEFHKPAGKTGPGSGRPAKMYRTAEHEIGVFVPDRNYDLAGELLAAAIEHSSAVGTPVHEALMVTSHEAGRMAAAGNRTLEAFLATVGYQPEPDGSGGLTLANCPFHRLADKHPATVCAMNGAFLRGAASACGDSEQRVQRNDTPGQCCARIAPA